MTDAERSILDLVRSRRQAEAVDELFRLRPREVVEATRTAVVHAITVDRDVPSAILIGWTGATRVQALARDAPTIHGLDRELAEHARSLFFTLGSLLWPGWSTPELHLDRTALAAGRACAGRARSLAEALDTPGLARSRCHWLFGVHALFHDEAATARAELEEAARRAGAAGAHVEARLLAAYVLMAQAHAQPENSEVLVEFARRCREFEAEASTEPFGRQLRAAWAALAPARELADPPGRGGAGPRSAPT